MLIASFCRHWRSTRQKAFSRAIPSAERQTRVSGGRKDRDAAAGPDNRQTGREAATGGAASDGSNLKIPPHRNVVWSACRAARGTDHRLIQRAQIRREPREADRPPSRGPTCRCRSAGSAGQRPGLTPPPRATGRICRNLIRSLEIPADSLARSAAFRDPPYARSAVPVIVGRALALRDRQAEIHVPSETAGR